MNVLYCFLHTQVSHALVTAKQYPWMHTLALHQTPGNARQYYGSPSCHTYKVGHSMKFLRLYVYTYILAVSYVMSTHAHDYQHSINNTYTIMTVMKVMYLAGQVHCRKSVVLDTIYIAHQLVTSINSHFCPPLLSLSFTFCLAQSSSGTQSTTLTMCCVQSGNAFLQLYLGTLPSATCSTEMVNNVQITAVV